MPKINLAILAPAVQISRAITHLKVPRTKRHK